MAEPVEIIYDADKENLLKAIPKTAESVNISVHGFRSDLGLVSLMFDDDQLLYLHLIEKDGAKTKIRYAPSVAYLADKDESVIPTENIEKFSHELENNIH